MHWILQKFQKHIGLTEPQEMIESMWKRIMSGERLVMGSFSVFFRDGYMYFYHDDGTTESNNILLYFKVFLLDLLDYYEEVLENSNFEHIAKSL